MTVLLIVGTDTAAGKSVLTTALAAYWQKYCRRPLGILKLLQTGAGDRELYGRLFGDDPDIRLATPVAFATPAAPPIAAAIAGERVDLKPIWEALMQLRQTQALTLVEALGGLGSPVTDELTVADIAALWHLPAVLVVPVRLGAIAQTVANIALARQVGVDLRGIILNCQQPDAESNIDLWAPPDLLLQLGQVPVLGMLPHMAAPEDVAELARGASNLVLDAILPVSC